MNPRALFVTAAPRRLPVWTAIWLLIGGFVVVLASPSGASAGASGASLAVSPRTYVGGQSVTFEGHIGRAGVRTIRLQSHMGRSGDAWNPVEGFSSKTNADGSFRFTHPAPGMFNIRYRVVAAGLATPAWTFEARSQDLTLEIVSLDPAFEDGHVVAGVPFGIHVDTTPVLARRPDLPAPVFPGRTLTLQQRVDGNRWKTLDTTVTNTLGKGQFVTQSAKPGVVVYRVRQENWTQGDSRIGWFPSFPTYVDVLGASDPYVAPDAEPRPDNATPRPVENSAATTASQTHQWAPSHFDFAWESGESLTSKPFRGNHRRGWWLDTSNGSGRASQHNGGMMLDSQRDNVDGPGDFGTTAVTLNGNPLTYGRWEGRLRLKSSETNARDYRVRLELIPARARDYHCGAQNITVAEVAAHGSTVSIGARARNGKKWTRTVSGVPINGRAIAFAVEMSKSHISWFTEGKLVGSVRSRAAVPDVPMTLRLSMVGSDRREMNRTQVISDWMRGFTLDRGALTKGGPALRAGTHKGGC